MPRVGFTREQLIRTILEISGMDEITKLIDSQITKYVRDGLSFKDIARALAFFYVVQEGHDIEKIKTTGIAIVPYVVKQALQYFEEEAARVKRQEEQAQKYKEQAAIINIVCNKEIKRKKITKKLVDISGIKEEK